MKSKKKDLRRAAYEAAQAKKGRKVAITIFVACVILSLLLIILNIAMQ